MESYGACVSARETDRRDPRPCISLALSQTPSDPTSLSRSPVRSPPRALLPSPPAAVLRCAPRALGGSRRGERLGGRQRSTVVSRCCLPTDSQARHCQDSCSQAEFLDAIGRFLAYFVRKVFKKLLQTTIPTDHREFSGIRKDLFSA